MDRSCMTKILLLTRQEISESDQLLQSSLRWNQSLKAFVIFNGVPKNFSNQFVYELQKPRGGSDHMLYSYKRSFSGFAAMLTSEEVQKLTRMEGVISVFPNGKMQLHTTRSWTFIGLTGKSERRPLERDMIIGMLDTGIWPESESFSDEGFGPPPQKWKGTCMKSENFTCNNKIIGAKYYRVTGNFSLDVASPRDTEGHGSHTASTAAGNFVPKASLEGLGLGTARGGAPSARIAVYKICWADGCYDADILAAFDDAIADGVDIISVSLGATNPKGYFEDSIAIGTFHAMRHGILTSTSAGNDGPTPGSVNNAAPWLLSVAASSIDRKFMTKIQLGNGASYEGVSINTVNLYPTMYPIIYGGRAPTLKKPNVTAARNCQKGSLERRLVRGKIVLCDLIVNGESVSAAGGVGAMMQDNTYNDVAYNFAVPASHFGPDPGSKISAYVKQTENATATMFKSIHQRDDSAPYIVGFSSRGPNAITKDILKPDIAAPGSDILAAWSPATTVTGLVGDKRVTNYNIISGTSMACPHATGVAAYVKSFQPTWSPAALRSALMTTAMPMSRAKNHDAEFAYGAGLINPVKAVDPGLVYDAAEEEYVHFLCGQGYNSTQIQILTGEDIHCSNEKKLAVWDLNYPSLTLSVKPGGGSVTRVFHRTVTNVGSRGSCTYKAIVKVPEEVVVKVRPSVLTFQSVGESKSFTVTVVVKLGKNSVSGALIWDDGEHTMEDGEMSDDGDVELAAAIDDIALDDEEAEVYVAACSPTDPSLVATGGADERGFLWRIGQGDWAAELGGHRESVTSLAFSSDGQFLASGGLDSVVKIWDESGNLICTLGDHVENEQIEEGTLGDHVENEQKEDPPTDGLELVRWQPGGHLVLAVSNDGTAWVWDADTGRTICTGSGDKSLRIWNLETGQCVHVVRGGEYLIWSLRFSFIHCSARFTKSELTCLTWIGTSRLVAAGCADGAIVVWDARDGTKTYIVYMGSVSAEKNNDNHLLAAHRHHNLLSSLLGDEDLAQQVRLTSYGKSFDGFAANLLPQEAEWLQENENVVSVFLSGTKQLSTTWSWDYLDMPLSVQRNFDMESDIIIGMIDSGINVDAPSFSDKGLGPPPAKWKGICQKGLNFTGCNNKVIGARAYDVGNLETTPLTPLDDTEGHGTHTASTVAGSAVGGASFRGLAKGTARGGVPSARLAIYKVCGPKAACTDANLMSALDDAIHDGVDVISMSLGAPAMDYFKDPVAIGSFHAMEKGIIVSAAAGNKGEMGQVENVAPWILTVAASRTGKQLRTPIVLGNRFATLVQGKIVYCKNGESAPLDTLSEFGAVGLIGDAVSWYPDFPQTYPMPASLLDPTRGQIVDGYINSTKDPRAYILKTTGVNVTAPAVAVFSSRGPNQQSRTILKPDVMAPGVNILAAFPPYLPGEDNSYGHPFRFLSGTSMACPHAIAAAAFVKSHRPHWSPAAVKSALMTTARVAKEQNPLAEYAYGSGEIDPVKALDPGLET
ncbi:unnamed protein product [Linum tenue]|uniref:Cucumisin n=1 Tax=Linum tenue TaxID=586396 RepID=A0AAV0JRQ6_9ROSI|nr:unnamed protein product [Linum tenue]